EMGPFSDFVLRISVFPHSGGGFEGRVKRNNRIGRAAHIIPRNPRSPMSLVMFGFGWLTLRQAQVALDTGRLEEAQRLLSQPSIQSHRRTGELVRRLARALAERGERHLRNDDPEAGWLDLLQAEQLQTSERGTDRLRQALT